MGKTLVTGASGHFGRLTLQSLLKRKVPASKLAALVRDPSKAADLAALGVEIHQGDYMDPPSLLKAFKGVEKVQLTSARAFTDRKTAHANVIDAAVKSGVKQIVYMPIARKEHSDFVMKEVTTEDIFTENKILASGLTYTFLKHPPFLNTLPQFIGRNALDIGVRVPAGNGKTAPATREDLAEAHAAVLCHDAHENTSYIPTGDPAVSLSEMAAILSKISGKKVPLVTVSDQEYIEIGIANGLPDFVAPFILGWVKGFNRGEWDSVTGDLERLIGHKPTTTEEYFRSLYVKENHL